LTFSSFYDRITEQKESRYFNMSNLKEKLKENKVLIEINDKQEKALLSLYFNKEVKDISDSDYPLFFTYWDKTDEFIFTNEEYSGYDVIELEEKDFQEILSEVEAKYDKEDLFKQGLLLADVKNRKFLKEVLDEKNIVSLNTIAEKEYEGVFYEQEKNRLYSRDFYDWRFFVDDIRG